MQEDLIKLYNTLKLISTKGEDTKIMGRCLEFTEELIAKCGAKAVSEQPMDNKKMCDVAQEG